MSAAEQDANGKQVIIVGGGLAGLAAAVGLADRGLHVTLLEARQSLGGRAGSYRDADSGELIDHCQHVAMGCCTNFLDLCERTGCSDLLERHRRLYFFSAEGKRSDFAAVSWLPAPMHLLPAMIGMRHLSWRDKVGIGRAMFALMRMKAGSPPLLLSTKEWLEEKQQTPIAIERFWKVVLVSALADSLENIPLAAARKVFVDGFLAHRSAAEVLIPRGSLHELYDRRIACWLRERRVAIHLGEPVKRIASSTEKSIQVQTATREFTADCVVIAVPWKHVRGMLDDQLAANVPNLPQAEQMAGSPISSVHLWTDRPLLTLPHAVLIDRLSQWIFARKDLDSIKGHYYQVVISASRELSGRPKQAVIDEVWQDLQTIFPAARDAQLRSAKLITQREAVFCDFIDGKQIPRVSQKTAHAALVLAGDWTDTGWPATMEGAVRSGYLAAEQVLRNLGEQNAEQQRILQRDLPRGWLARLLIR